LTKGISQKERRLPHIQQKTFSRKPFRLDYILDTVTMQLNLTLTKVFLALLPFFITTSLAQDGDKDSATTASLAPQVSSYLAHLTEKPQYSSIAAIVSTAVSGTKGQSRLLNGDLSKVTTRSWYDPLPSDVKIYASSVESERNKLATASGGSIAIPAPSSSATPAPKSAGSAPSVAPSASAPSPPKASTSPAAASQSATKNGAAEIQARGLLGVVAGIMGALVL
jgi:hypothetical protein